MPAVRDCRLQHNLGIRSAFLPRREALRLRLGSTSNWAHIGLLILAGSGDLVTACNWDYSSAYDATKWPYAQGFKPELQ